VLLEVGIEFQCRGAGGMGTKVQIRGVRERWSPCSRAWRTEAPTPAII
jgi:hypothetical protein